MTLFNFYSEVKMKIQITDLIVRDLRFPTSRDLAGSDAMHRDPDYSATYVILKTNQPGLEGHGLTFTIGRGNEICVAAAHALRHMIVGETLAGITENMGAWWHHFINGDSQLRWIGPEKGAIHLASAAIVNAVWDLWAKHENKPVWRLVAEMSPEKLVSCIDFKYITDAITPDEAITLLEKNAAGKITKNRNSTKKKGIQLIQPLPDGLAIQMKKCVPRARTCSLPAGNI